jgi:hypothetical protein
MALEIQARSDIIKLHNCVNKNIDYKEDTFRRTYLLCNTNSSIYIHNIRILSVYSQKCYSVVYI